MKKEKTINPNETVTAQAEEKEEKTDSKTWTYLLWLLPAMCPALVYGLIGNFASQTGGMVLTGCIRLAATGLVWFFVMMVAGEKDLWKYDNGKHKGRFLVTFFIGILISVFSAFFEPLLWLYLPLAAALILFSELPQAVAGFLFLLMFQQLLAGPTLEVFVTLALIGIFTALLFDFVDESFLFGLPLFATLLFDVLLLLVMEFAMRGALPVSVYITALADLIISFLLLTGLLKYLSLKVVYRRTDLYGRINDPEFELLSQLKEQNKRAYYHAVHTAHFCQKLAEQIGADEQLAKAGGYYHKIGRMRGESNLKNTLDIAAEYDFPQELVQLLKEYGGKDTPLVSKEAAIVLLSDAMVSSVMFLFEKNKDARLNYDQIVSVVFSKQMESGLLDKCELTLGEMNSIRQCFAQERLYYDFLR